MKILLIGALALSLASCNTASVLTAPVPVNTLAEAINLDTVAAHGVDIYVRTGMPNAATLKTLAADAEAVHTALKGLEAAQASGQPLSFAAFNAAYTAFQNYSASQGVKVQ